MQHFFYAGDLYQFRIDRFPFWQVYGEACDAFGEVTEAFQVRVDLIHGEYETEVDGYRRVQSNDIFEIAVDLQLECIYAAFAAEHFIGQFLVSGQHRFTSIVYLLMDECPHLVDCIL